MKLSKKLSAGTLLLSSITAVSADKLDDVVSDAKNKGFNVDIITKKKEVKSKEEYDKLVLEESKLREDEAKKLNFDITNFEKVKKDAHGALVEYDKKVKELNDDYDRKVSEYKKEFDRVSKERSRLTLEYETLLKNFKLENDFNKAVSERYENDLKEYNKKLETYNNEVSKIEVDFKNAMDEYNRKLSEYNLKKSKSDTDYEKLKNDILARNKKVLEDYEKQKSEILSSNKKAQSDYEKLKSEIEARNKKAQYEYEKQKSQVSASNKQILNDYDKKKAQIEKENLDARNKYEANKARIEKENAAKKANYESEVAAIKAENESKDAEYKKAITEWKNKKKISEVIKTKDLVNSTLDAKIEEAKGAGVKVNVGSDEVVELDGTNGKLSEADATKKLNEMVATRVNELKKAVSDATNVVNASKDYNDHVNVIKSELTKIKNVVINYSDVGNITDVDKAKKDLDASLARVKMLSKLATKVSEVNDKIKNYNSSILNELRSAGVNDVNEVYGNSKVIPSTDFEQEYGTLVAKSDLSDSDIDTYISKIEDRLEASKESVRKAIRNGNTPRGGTVLSESEYNRKLEEYKSKVREWNAHRNDHFAYANIAFESDLNDTYKISKNGLNNKTNIDFVSSTGNVTYYVPKNFSSSDNPNDIGDYLAFHSHIENTSFSRASRLTFGTTGTTDYSRIKLGVDASITVAYTLKNGNDIFDNNCKENRTVTYKIVNGRKVLTNVKTIRMKFTNNGSEATRDGSTIAYLMNNLREALIAAYTTTQDWEGERGRDNVSGLYRKVLHDLTYEYELLDEDGERLNVGLKEFEEIDEDKPLTGEPKYTIIDPTTIPRDRSTLYLWGDKGSNLDVYNNVGFITNSNDSSFVEPSNWDSIRSARWIHEFISESRPGHIGLRVKYFNNKDWIDKVEGRYDNSVYHAGNRITVAGIIASSKPILEAPTFNYTKAGSDTPITVASIVRGGPSYNVGIGKVASSENSIIIRKPKVVYKYNEVFTEVEPKAPVKKPTPDSASVTYTPLPKPPVDKVIPSRPSVPNLPDEPVLEKVPVKPVDKLIPNEPTLEKVPDKVTSVGNPPTLPVKPNLPIKPTKPLKPNVNGPVDKPKLDLPDLPKEPVKPTLPIKPTDNVEDKVFKVVKNEYVLVSEKSRLSSSSNSITVKKPIASFANSFTIRVL